MAKQAPQVVMTKEQIAALQLWEQEKTALDATKQAEIVARIAAIDAMPFDPAKEQGAQTLALGAGWKLELDRSINYTLDKDQTKFQVACEALAVLNMTAAQKIIRWKPEIDESVYKKLSDEEKLTLASIVTTKPGTPSLTLKAPSQPKK